jgi:type IV pilus assembly protein PilV
MHRSRANQTAAYQGEQGGFTLLEVLVSIVILSIGLLGSAGMLLQAMQSNKVAREQSTAARLGRELGDLMRANKDVAIAATSGANPYLVSNFTGTLPTTTVECYTTNCTTSLQVAHWNIRDWLTRVKAELPGARAVVCFDSTPYVTSGSNEGIPQWACSNSGGTAVVKLGWATISSNSGTGADGGLDQATRPLIIYPVIAGSVE